MMSMMVMNMSMMDDDDDDDDDDYEYDHDDDDDDDEDDDDDGWTWANHPQEPLVALTHIAKSWEMTFLQADQCYQIKPKHCGHCNGIMSRIKW